MSASRQTGGGSTGADEHADRLRGDISSGRTGDKVPFPDPAAAPLGTDDEAAGTSPGPERVGMAMAQERRAEGDHGDPPGQTDERARDYSGDLKPNRSLMRRWRAVTLLAAGTVALSLVLWMLHG